MGEVRWSQLDGGRDDPKYNQYIYIRDVIMVT